jgi:hypothetical protein
MRRSRLLLACGALSPLVYVTSDVLAASTYEGYSYLHQTVSELNAFGAPSRPLTIALGLPVYLLLLAFAGEVRRSAAGRRRLRAAGTVLVVFALLSLLAVPIASMRVRGVEQGLAGTIHLSSGAVAVMLILTVMALAAAALDKRFRLYTLATIVVMLAFGAWAGMEGARIAEGLPTPWVGVKERISVYSYQLWFMVFALALLNREQATAAVAQSERSVDQDPRAERAMPNQ